jgi:hypothetical protein
LERKRDDADAASLSAGSTLPAASRARGCPVAITSDLTCEPVGPDLSLSRRELIVVAVALTFGIDRCKRPDKNTKRAAVLVFLGSKNEQLLILSPLPIHCHICLTLKGFTHTHASPTAQPRASLPAMNLVTVYRTIQRVSSHVFVYELVGLLSMGSFMTRTKNSQCGLINVGRMPLYHEIK